MRLGHGPGSPYTADLPKARRFSFDEGDTQTFAKLIQLTKTPEATEAQLVVIETEVSTSTNAVRSKLQKT